MEFIAGEFTNLANNDYARFLLRVLKRNSNVFPEEIFLKINTTSLLKETVNVFGVNALLDDGNNFLTKLARDAGNLHMVDLLIESGIDLEFLAPDKKSTALTLSALKGQFEYVKLLVKAGAKINTVCASMSPLIATCSKESSAEIARFLLDNGADINEKFIKFGNAITSAARMGKLDVAKLLIDRGADVNSKTRRSTALINAVGAGQCEMVKFLIEHDVDVNQVNDDGKSALSCAYHFNQISSVIDLISAGARRDIRDKFGKYPVDYLKTETREMFEI